jgi:cation diffusion facilitator family transporter
MSGAASILSEAIHSSMDLMAALVAYYSVKVSDTPADDEHPYGHGKFENVTGVIEALLIIVAAVWNIVEAIHKISANKEIKSLGIRITVMLVSSIVNYFVSGRLSRVAKETGSVAIEADSFHLRTDVYISEGVVVGLFLIWLTGTGILIRERGPCLCVSTCLRTGAQRRIKPSTFRSLAQVLQGPDRKEAVICAGL